MTELTPFGTPVLAKSATVLPKRLFQAGMLPASWENAAQELLSRHMRVQPSDETICVSYLCGLTNDGNTTLVDAVAGPDEINNASVNFVELGFEAGRMAELRNCTTPGNDGVYGPVEAVTANQILLPTGSLSGTDAVGAAVMILQNPLSPGYADMEFYQNTPELLEFIAHLIYQSVENSSGDDFWEKIYAESANGTVAAPKTLKFWPFRKYPR